MIFGFDHLVHLSGELGLAGDGRAEGRHCEAVFWGGGSIGVIGLPGADGEVAVHSGNMG